MKHILFVTLTLSASSAFCMESAAPTNAPVALRTLTVSLQSSTTPQELDEHLTTLRVYFSRQCFVPKSGKRIPLSTVVDWCLDGDQGAYEKLKERLENKKTTDIENAMFEHHGKKYNDDTTESIDARYQPVLTALEALKLHVDQKNAPSPLSHDENAEPVANTRKGKSTVEELPASPKKKQAIMNSVLQD